MAPVVPDGYEERVQSWMEARRRERKFLCWYGAAVAAVAGGFGVAYYGHWLPPAPWLYLCVVVVVVLAAHWVWSVYLEVS